MKRVLVVDDKEMMRESVGATLERAGFAVETAIDGATALASIALSRPDAVLTDMRMPSMTGVELLGRIRQIDDELPVVMMTAFGTIDAAVKAMRLGAFDYLTKPFEGDELVIAIKRAIEHHAVLRENGLLRAATGPVTGQSRNRSAEHTGASRAESAAPGGGTEVSREGVNRLIGDSDAMRALRDQILAVADSVGTVLITGESGAGKEVVARAVHDSSPRRDGPYLAVNCAALSESLLESELFGHERGAFTGAEKLRKGRFELSDGGTLLLDEISEVSPSLQAKLLRVLQERSFERVGSSTTIGIDVRIICTSNRDLPQSVAKGDFRQDLYFRLNVLPLCIPPLRGRRDDVPPLARHFVRAVCEREGRQHLDLDDATLAVMRAYDWPGNVRELANICERAVVLSGGRGSAASAPGLIRKELVEAWLETPKAVVDHSLTTLPSPRPVLLTAMEASLSEPKPQIHMFTPSHPTTVNPGALEDIERAAILDALGRFGGHRLRTAQALGIGVRTLGLKLKKWKEQGTVEAGV